MSYRAIGTLLGGAGTQRVIGMHMCTQVNTHMHAPWGLALLPPEREGGKECACPISSLVQRLIKLGGPSLMT